MLFLSLSRTVITAAWTSIACIVISCTDAPTSSVPPSGLAELNDEFDNAASLADWQRVYIVEQWGFDQLETVDVNTSRLGWLRMVPYTNGWFEDYRGLLAFKELTGDFVISTSIEVSNRAGTGAPSVRFSLGGIMVRAPRSVTPATWVPGGENYIFLAIGAANTAGTFQTEVKTTINSVSTLQIGPGVSSATIRIARIGPAMILLTKLAGGVWQVHQRYLRDDFPATLQAGLTSYTDWDKVSTLTPAEHNKSLITNGAPDLIADFDYVYYQEPDVPEPWVGLDFSNAAEISDADILSFLGFD